MNESHERPYPSFVQLPWRSRGYLPHFDERGRIQSLTFRLAGSLPLEKRREIEAQIPARLTAERRAAYEELLDAGNGACWLRQPGLARIVEEALLHFDGERCRTLAWCIMPNHVHWLMEVLEGFELGKVMQSVKGFTGRACNERLQRQGAFWEREYFDRAIRDELHLRNTVEYIHNNPVKAGLTRWPEDWRWSSAWGSRLGTLPV
jgi:REP element-mobilizing transposase RayT